MRTTYRRDSNAEDSKVDGLRHEVVRIFFANLKVEHAGTIDILANPSAYYT